MMNDTNNYEDPPEWILDDPMFVAIWKEIKSWDINVPQEYDGYCGATGNHVMAIYNAIQNEINRRIYEN